MYNRKNLFESRLAAGIAAAATSFSVTTGEGQYAPDSTFVVGVYRADYKSPSLAIKAGKHEWMIIGSRTTDAMSAVVRGAFGSTALDHNESGYEYVIYQPLLADELIGVNRLFKDTGLDDAYVITTGFGLTDLNRHDGSVFLLRVTTGNTGACGVTVDSVTSKSIKVVGSSGARDPLTGEIPADGIAILQWSEDDDYFVLLNPLGGGAQKTYVDVPYQFFFDSNQGAGNTYYYPIGGGTGSSTEDNVAHPPFGVTATIVGMNIQLGTNSLNVGSSFTLRYGAADATSLSDSNITVPLTAGVQNGSDSAHTLAVTPTMIGGIKVITSAGTGTITLIGVTLVYRLTLQ
jgi:hypothetical protein